MSEYELSELGPVDYLVVEFPAGHQTFTGEIAEELLALVEAGTIRVIDVIIIAKDEEASIARTLRRQTCARRCCRLQP